MKQGYFLQTYSETPKAWDTPRRIDRTVAYGTTEDPAIETLGVIFDLPPYLYNKIEKTAEHTWEVITNGGTHKILSRSFFGLDELQQMLQARVLEQV